MSFLAGVLDTTLNLVTTKSITPDSKFEFLLIYLPCQRQPPADIWELKNVRQCNGCYFYCSLDYCAHQSILLQ